MEISKQEAHLANLHRRIASQEHLSDKTSIEQLSDELWALQRYVTSLKRKVKKLKQERKQIEADQLQSLSNQRLLARIRGGQEEDDKRNQSEQNERKHKHINLRLTSSVNIKFNVYIGQSGRLKSRLL